MPHSEFLEWSDLDRSKALAFIIYRASICDLCGTAPWEWDPEQDGSRFAYEPVEEICPGCEKKDWLRDNDSSQKRRAGSFISLKRPEGK